MVPTPRRARRLDKISLGTSCEEDNNGRTLEKLMLSLASMTGNLMGGDTLAAGLAGGGAIDAGVAQREGARLAIEGNCCVA